MEQNKKTRKKPGPPKGVKGVRIVFNDAQVKEVEKYAAVGLNLDQIAALMDVSPKTLDTIMVRQLEVGYAVKKGKAKGIGRVAQSLFSIATNTDHPKQFSAICFYLKTQGRWVEARDEGEALKEDPYEPPDSLVDDDDDN